MGDGEEKFALEDSVKDKKVMFEICRVERVIVSPNGYGINIGSSIFDAEGNRRTNFQRARDDISRFDNSGKIHLENGDVEEIRTVSYGSKDPDCPIYLPNVPWETFVRWGRPERIPVYTGWNYRIGEGEIDRNE